MCGTSQDALDIADVTIHFDNPIGYTVHGTRSVPLSDSLKERLRVVFDLNAQEYLLLDNEVGEFFGASVKAFVESTHSSASFVASHGITSFHQPARGLTHQLGNGAIISSLSGLPVITNFRAQDVALGGQGAPLVPFCDQRLFSEYDATLNLGGFANVTLLQEETLIGFDIAPANMMLNHLANQIGLPFDADGKQASKGSLDSKLLEGLHALPYYALPAPKSLGKEWFEKEVIPLLENSSAPLVDQLHTAVVHIAKQVGQVLNFNGTCLVTGGGAWNTFLLDQIQAKSKARITCPENRMIEFKEAICFALLGALRIQEAGNVAPTVTGAQHAARGGYLHLPPLE